MQDKNVDFCGILKSSGRAETSRFSQDGTGAGSHAYRSADRRDDPISF
ncbi:MAG: hypothetical protein V8T09_02665 [Oscillospiraceae bacterium]